MNKTISTRLLAQKELFDSLGYFKMICGAGNEDLEEVRRLSMIYTLSGAGLIVISSAIIFVREHQLKKPITLPRQQ